MNQHARIQWDLAMIEAQSLTLNYSWLHKPKPLPQQRDSQQGGKRPGSGRKPLDGVGTINTTVRLTPEQQLHFADLGGSKWLRAYLEEHIKRNRIS